jgi:hypothetical protein
VDLRQQSATDIMPTQRELRTCYGPSSPVSKTRTLKRQAMRTTEKERPVLLTLLSSDTLANERGADSFRFVLGATHSRQNVEAVDHFCCELPKYQIISPF